MIAAIDAGGTGTDIALWEKQREAKFYHSAGINPQSMDADILAKNIDALVNVSQLNNASCIFYYGAGCGANEQADKMYQILQPRFPHAILLVASDIVGAGRAVLGNQKGIACILGTGSACAKMKNGEIEQYLPSGGYLIGDEGSGAYIGKQFVRGLLNKTAPKHLATLFFKEMSVNDEQIIPFFYKGNSQQKFAKVFRFLYQYKEDVFVKNLFNDGVAAFFNFQVTPYLKPNKNPQLIGFCGSVAWCLQDILKQNTEKAGLQFSKVLQKPITGIVNYHTINL